MPLVLNVPYAEKDEAKRLGAMWNPDIKTWYVANRKDYIQFARWLDGQIIVADHIYIVEGTRKCHHCGENTPVIGFGIDCMFDLYDPNHRPYSGSVSICQIDSQLPQKIEEQLNARFGFKRDYTRKYLSYANYCKNCGRKQGNNYVYEEVGSPLFICGREQAERLTLHRIQLPHDICVSASMGFGSDDHLIKECARMADSDMQWSEKMLPAEKREHEEATSERKKAEEYVRLYNDFTERCATAKRYENEPADTGAKTQPISKPQITYAQESLPPKSALANWYITLILAILLGWFGVHRVYSGKFRTGILYALTFGLGGIGWFLDIVLISTEKFRDKLGYQIRRE